MSNKKDDKKEDKPKPDNDISKTNNTFEDIWGDNIESESEYDDDLCSEFDAFRVKDNEENEEFNMDNFDDNMDKIINHYEQSAQEKNNQILLQKKKEEEDRIKLEIEKKNEEANKLREIELEKRRKKREKKNKKFNSKKISNNNLDKYDSYADDYYDKYNM